MKYKCFNRGRCVSLDRSELKKCRRVVVKVGTSTITHGNGKINIQRMDRLCRALADLHNRGTDVLLVSSGAVGAGMGRLGYSAKPASLPVKQALAAVGQGLLMQMYEKLFSEYGCTTAQNLLTRVGFNDRSRYLNLCNTMHALADMNVIPVINENDTIAVDELKFGDNDTLSALVACAAGADLLIILSDIDGLYDADPRVHKDAKLIHEVRAVSQSIRDNSGSKGSNMSSGGMYTKITAADVVLPAGIPLVIASGAAENVLHRILAGEVLGTLFIPPVEHRHARKQWIAANRPFESVTIDAGAVKALTEQGGSLLAKGITAVNGEFEAGRLLAVLAPNGQEIARGLTNFNSRDLKKIMGHRSDEFEALLGEKDFDEAIHRDNLTVL